MTDQQQSHGRRESHSWKDRPCAGFDRVSGGDRSAGFFRRSSSAGRCSIRSTKAISRASMAVPLGITRRKREGAISISCSHGMLCRFRLGGTMSKALSFVTFTTSTFLSSGFAWNHVIDAFDDGLGAIAVDIPEVAEDSMRQGYGYGTAFFVQISAVARLWSSFSFFSPGYSKSALKLTVISQIGHIFQRKN